MYTGFVLVCFFTLSHLKLCCIYITLGSLYSVKTFNLNQFDNYYCSYVSVTVSEIEPFFSSVILIIFD